MKRPESQTGPPLLARLSRYRNAQPGGDLLECATAIARSRVVNSSIAMGRADIRKQNTMEAFAREACLPTPASAAAVAGPGHC